MNTTKSGSETFKGNKHRKHLSMMVFLSGSYEEAAAPHSRGGQLTYGATLKEVVEKFTLEDP